MTTDAGLEPVTESSGCKQPLRSTIASRIEKPQYTSPKKSYGRVASANYSVKRSPASGSGFNDRPTCQRIQLPVDPFKCHPVHGSFQTSPSLALRSFPETMSTPSVKHEVMPHPAGPHAMDEVAQKVNAMLAATEALKPPGTTTLRPTITGRSRPIRRASSRLFAPFTKAWDRLNSKEGQDPKHASHSRPTRSHSVADRPRPSPKPSQLSQDDHNFSSISTLAVLLNEGQNLSKRKVHEVLSDGILRRYFAKDEELVEDDRLKAEDSSELNQQDDTQLSRDLETSDMHRQTPETIAPETDPFSEEENFFDDLSHGILSTLPVGSSTPRPPRSISLETSRYDQESPSRLVAERSQARVRVQVSSASSGSSKPHNTQLSTSHSGDDTSLCDAVKQICKKHPSPSKGYLEELEVAFRDCYPNKVEQQQRGPVGQIMQPGTRKPILQPQDKNKKIGRRASKSVSETPPDTKQSMILSCGEGSQNQALRPSARLAAPYRPAVPDADEPDELQWPSANQDEPQYF